MIVADLPPEGGGADAELLCGELPAAVVFTKAGYDEITIDVVTFWCGGH